MAGRVLALALDVEVPTRPCRAVEGSLCRIRCRTARLSARP